MTKKSPPKSPSRLRGWGYEVERQPFTFSTAPNVFLKLVVLAASVLVLLMLLAHGRFSIIADVAALLLMLLVALFMPLNRRVQSAALEQNGRGLKWGQRYTTANLIATAILASCSCARVHQERHCLTSISSRITIPRASACRWQYALRSSCWRSSPD